MGTAVFGLIVTAFTAVCSFEIIYQAWHPPRTETTLSCREGLGKLISAVRRAREVAVRVQGGERETVSRFRGALEPEWSFRPALDDRCASDAEARSALGEVDRLRYAEEHALRYEELDIANRRRRVEALERTLSPGH